MFWGLIMEPGRCYTQTVKSSFHVSMAALDISNSTDDPAQVMCVFEGRNYLLCTLNKTDQIVQVPLDLNFMIGSKVSFATNGKSHVHLTGYLTNFEDEEGEENEEEEEEVVFDDPPLKKRSKRLAALGGPPQKKIKGEISSDALEEDSSDSDFEIETALQKADVSEEEEDEEEEEEGDSSDDDDDDEVEDEETQENAIDAEEIDDDDEEEVSSLSEDDDENDVVIQTKEEKPKQNGTPKPNNTPKQKGNKSPEKIQQKEKPKKQEKQPRKVVLKGGVIVSDLKEGSGPTVKGGKFVQVYYEGRLKDNNKMFDSTTKGPGFSFRVGKGEVIKGWDIGVIGMKPGGKRRIVCPPGVAYGPKGSPPVIPPNATLVFDVELKKIS